MSVSAHVLYASLQLNWATTMGGMLGATTCLLHTEGDIPLGILPKNTTTSLPACSPHYPFCAERQAGKR